MDSIVSSKVRTMKGEGVRVRSLAHNISKVEGRARILEWGLGRLITNLVLPHQFDWIIHCFQNSLKSVLMIPITMLLS